MKSMKQQLLNPNIELDDISDGWWTLNLETNKFNFSLKLLQKLGYGARDKALQAEEFKLIYADDLQTIIENFTTQNKLKTKLIQPIRYLHSDGQTVWSIFKGKSIKNEDGKIIKIIGIHIDITAIKVAEEKLQTLALYDSLTNLPNRPYFLEILANALAKAKRQDSQVAVFFIDVDNLKYVNDTFGHRYGDQLLTQISKVLVEKSRSIDFIARIGGDEFGIIIEDIQMINRVADIADRYIKAFEKIHHIKQKKVASTVSIGIAVFPGDGKSSKELLKNADTAMYRAKAEGKNNFVCFSKPII